MEQALVSESPKQQISVFIRTVYCWCVSISCFLPGTFPDHPKKVCAPHVTIMIDIAPLLTHNDTALGAGLYHHYKASCLKTGPIYPKNLYILSFLPVPSIQWLLKTYLLTTRWMDKWQNGCCFGVVASGKMTEKMVLHKSDYLVHSVTFYQSTPGKKGNNIQDSAPKCTNILMLQTLKMSEVEQI